MQYCVLVHNASGVSPRQPRLDTLYDLRAILIAVTGVVRVSRRKTALDIDKLPYHLPQHISPMLC